MLSIDLYQEKLLRNQLSGIYVCTGRAFDQTYWIPMLAYDNLSAHAMQ